jgi:hypothetical protein
MSRLSTRLDRLERRQAEVDDVLPLLWQILSGEVSPEDIPIAVQEQLQRLLDQAEAEHDRFAEQSVAGKLYREQIVRLGLPQPETLADIDIIEEALRLVGIPGPRPCALRELSAKATAGELLRP